MKHVFRFAKNFTEYPMSDDLPLILGSKGLGLIKMTEKGYNVPPGFVITSKITKLFLDTSIRAEIREGLKWLEETVGGKFGKDFKVSVRSGSKYSMPGMMETFLDVDSGEELLDSILKVVMSWSGSKAQTYRKIENLPDVGTAIVIQKMVYGDIDDLSGTGVCFTRHPGTGAPELYGEYLHMARGDEIVSGSKTPVPVNKMDRELYMEILALGKKLEKDFRDLQEFEFTVENFEIFLLQTRNAKRSSQAAVRVAVDMAAENVLTKREALDKVVKYIDLDKHQPIPIVDDTKQRHLPLGKGISASPGLAAGFPHFTSEEVVKSHMPAILIREETTTDDIEGMFQAAGILTKIGGSTSHAATVARGMNKPCVAGCSELEIDFEKRTVKIGKLVLGEISLMTIDGNTGNIYPGIVKYKVSKEDEQVEILKKWRTQIESTHEAIRRPIP